MTKFKLTLRCTDCGHKWTKVVECRDSNIDEVPNPPCVKCKKTRKRKHGGLKEIVASGRGPAVTGNNIKNQAIDETARIVMEDFGMSDLKTNTREGDSQVPSLTPRQQAMSKHFWGGSRARKPLVDMKQTVSSAMQGAFLPGRGARAGEGAVSGNEVLTSLHSRRVAPKVSIIADATRDSLQK